MANGPFKMAGWSPFTKSSPAKNEEEKGQETSDPNAYEKMLQADKDAGKTLTPQQEKILGKYQARKAREERKSAPTRDYKEGYYKK